MHPRDPAHDPDAARMGAAATIPTSPTIPTTPIGNDGEDPTETALYCTDANGDRYYYVDSLTKFVDPA